MARYSSILAKEIRYGLRLIFDEQGNARMTRGAASLDRNERELALSITLPRTLFSTPSLSATISIAEPAPDAPQINIAGIERQLRAAIGADCTIEIVPAAVPAGD